MLMRLWKPLFYAALAGSGLFDFATTLLLCIIVVGVGCGCKCALAEDLSELFA